MWIKQLTGIERSTLFATFCGWMLDGMDVMVYSFVAPSLISLWQITQGQAGLLATSALLLSAAGGWLAGVAADYFGRVRVLQWTILWFAVFTFLSGFTTSFPQLLIVRGLQGLGFGGEWAVGSVLIGETIRPEWRGRAVGTVQGGWAVGWGMAALCYAILFSLLDARIAWRAMFWIGILPALLVIYIRRRVREPQIGGDAAGTQNVARSLSPFQIFSPEFLRVTIGASIIALGAQGGYYAVNTWLPFFLKNSRGLSVVNTAGYLLVVICGSFAGYLVAAHLSDRIGRRPTLILFAACSFITVLLYTGLSVGKSAMLALGFPLGFFPSGTFSPLGSFFSELFPTRLRGSGQGFSYNFGRALGAFFPTAVGYLSSAAYLGTSIAVFSASAYIALIAGVLVLPETRGRQLNA